MDESKRILLTGITGFVGQALCDALRKAGCEVWGISRRKTGDKNIVQGDLMSPESTVQALGAIPRCETVIHAAALAHAGKNQSDGNYLFINKTMTENLTENIRAHDPHFIFLSSVSVYGEDKKRVPVKVDAPLKPANDYGKSKLICEKIVQSKLTRHHILRLAPVYDEHNKTDIKKRVYLPGQEMFKLLLIPAPRYSFCHIDTVCRTIMDLLGKKEQPPAILNVADPVVYDQNTLSKQFRGISIPCPVGWMMLLYYLLAFLPEYQRHKTRSLFWKLFKDNIYE